MKAKGVDGPDFYAIAQNTLNSLRPQSAEEISVSSRI